MAAPVQSRKNQQCPFARRSVRLPALGIDAISEKNRDGAHQNFQWPVVIT